MTQNVRQANTHQCPAHNCNLQVPNYMLACRTHWYHLPQTLRNGIIRNHTRGQERNNGLITPAYWEAYDACVKFWEEKNATPTQS